MASVQAPPDVFTELADLFASGPTHEQLLKYRPSKALQRRARDLLAKQGEESLAEEEKLELDEFIQAELFMRLVKAKVHARRARKR